MRQRTLEILGAAAGVCWLVALVLALVPVDSDDGGLGHGCHLPIVDALGDDPFCTEGARTRVGHLGTWLVVTGAVSTAFMARAVRSSREPE
jgi:hypothetical protein